MELKTKNPSKYLTQYTENTNTLHSGTAIAIKHNISHKVTDNFIFDVVAVQVHKITGDIIKATLYLPLTRQYIPFPDFIRLFRRHQPVYMIADLNANHPTLGYRATNTIGRHIHTLNHNRTLNNVGPQFHTYFTHNTRTTPDIVLSN